MSQTNNVLKFYIRESRKTPKLTRKEEGEIFRSFAVCRKAINEAEKEKRQHFCNICEAPRKKMVEANLRLVVSIVMEYNNKKVDTLDLIQEGNIGLMKAIGKFEYERENKFSTYATWWIRHAVQMAVLEHGCTVRIPFHASLDIKKIANVSYKLKQKLERNPTTKEISVETGIPESSIENYIKSLKDSVSFETPVGENSEGCIGDFVKDNKPGPFENMVTGDRERKVRSILEPLDERESKIIKMRFGMDGNVENSLEEIGNDIGLTKERVRQIECIAMRKIRIAGNKAGLRTLVA